MIRSANPNAWKVSTLRGLDAVGLADREPARRGAR